MRVVLVASNPSLIKSCRAASRMASTVIRDRPCLGLRRTAISAFAPNFRLLTGTSSSLATMFAAATTERELRHMDFSLMGVLSNFGSLDIRVGVQQIAQVARKKGVGWTDVGAPKSE